jgi:hypothetical protein
VPSAATAADGLEICVIDRVHARLLVVEMRELL